MPTIQRYEPKPTVVDTTLGTKEVVNFCHLELSDEKVVPIAQELVENTTVKKLYLDGTLRQPFRAANLFVPPASGPRQSLRPAGNFLRQPSCDALGEALKVNKTLTFLSLKKCMVGCDGVAPILMALRTNETVTELNFDYARLRDAGAAALAQMLETNVTFKAISLRCAPPARPPARSLAMPSPGCRAQPG